MAKNENVFFYISLNDQVGALGQDKARAQGERKAAPIFSETRKVLAYFGVKPENIFEYSASETWNRLFVNDRNMPFLLMKAIRAVPQKAFAIPKENTSLEYLDPGTQYPLSYALPKFLDLFVADSFERLFPEDIEGKIDVFVTSFFGRPLVSKARQSFVNEGLISDLRPVFISIPKIPFFGHNKKIFKKHITPWTGMSLEDIYEAILLYKVKPEHISLMLGSGILEKPTGFDKMPQKKLPRALAKALFSFFKGINNAIGTEKAPVFLSLGSAETIEEFSDLFRSRLALQVLKECNGKTITGIAKKLDKQQPNISKAVSLLKKLGLVSVDNKGKLNRQVNTLKIDLARL